MWRLVQSSFILRESGIKFTQKTKIFYFGIIKIGRPAPIENLQLCVVENMPSPY